MKPIQVVQHQLHLAGAVLLGGVSVKVNANRSESRPATVGGTHTGRRDCVAAGQDHMDADAGIRDR